MSKFDIDDILNELGVDQVGDQANDLGGDAESMLPVMRDEPEPTGDGFQTIYQPDAIEAADTSTANHFGSYLLRSNAVNAKQLANAEAAVRQSPGRSLTEVLVEQGADEASVYRGMAEMSGVPFERVDLDRGADGGFDSVLVQRMGFEFCRDRLVLPLRREGTRIVVGTTTPDEVFLLDEIRRLLGGHRVKIVVVPPMDIREALQLLGDVKTEEQQDLSDILADVDDAEVEIERRGESNEVDLEQQAGESPVIRYVNYIIQNAIREGASDIHLEPADKKMKVRFRVDGMLCDMMQPPATMAAAITSRVKIMANLDISERRVPQDGRIRCTVQGRKLDLRVSTLPNGYGEKTVMRILDTKSINVELDQLGFSDDCLQIWKKQIKEPHGIILVTGPTGSGKTTTLYSSLRQLDKNALNISTAEDPVEYHLDGITQTQVHEKIGMKFSKVLRALLRQDPDVIMVGEIRDQETAHIAIQAALTGHLVLSTLHTNDAPSSITRLVNIGLEPFLVGAAVNAVLAQRLLRRLCQHCRVEEEPSEELQEYLMLQGMSHEKIWAARGCDRCRNSGYSGRVGIYELLTIDDQVRDIVARNPNVAEFRRLCIERGMVTLRQDGMGKVSAGLTTVEEVLRVTESGH